MRFFELLTLATALLQRERCVSYRALKREFDLDDEYLEDLKFELIEVKRLAVDQDGEILVWAGEAAVTPASVPCPVQPRQRADRPIELPPVAETPAEPHPADAERRQLTVMFTDLVGSTALSEQLDPEELREVIRAYQNACAKIITRFDGYIAKYMGDGVLIYFGFPQAHEDDAERAVRAGLDVVEAIAALNAEVGQAKGIKLAVRVGIATGLVVVGDIVGEGAAEERAVVGETPNRAARLQGIAQPNTVVIGPATRGLVGGLFEYEDFGTHSLKGITEPVQVWRVVKVSAAKSRFEATHAANLLPLVGRQEELGLLLRSWEQSKEGLGQVVLINGQAGIGKSRLVEALRDHVAEEGNTWIAFRCSPYYTTSALYPVIEYLQRVLGFERKETAEGKLTKLEKMLRTYSFPLKEEVPLFAALLSVPLPEGRYPPLNLMPQQHKQQTQDALVAWLMEEAERQPTLAVWEDLQWADPSTVELLGLLIDQSPTVPLLSVLTFRPEFAPSWHTRSHMTPITLNRLERPEIETMIVHLAGGRALPAEVVEHVVAKADGVPLFVEELTKMFLESKLLQEEDDHYALTSPLSNITIPVTLQDSLMARLDRLPTVREVAQLGAVLGREFAYEMIQALGAVDEKTLQEGLGQLVETELLYQRGRPPRARYLFKHALIQDAAYASLLKRTRKQYHQQIARLLEMRFPEVAEIQPELIAHHYTEAGCHEQAVEYWLRAGQRASERSANLEAISHLSEGLEVLKRLPDGSECAQRELTLRITLGGPLIVTQGYGSPEVEKNYARARELCRQVGETPLLFPVLRGLLNPHLLQAKYQTARELGEQLLDLAQDEQDPGHLVEAHRALGTILFFLGELIPARAHLEQGIALYDPHQHRSLALLYGADSGLVCQLYAALVLWLLGYSDQARNGMDKALTQAQILSHPHSQAFALAYASSLHQFRGEVQAARERAENVIALCTEQKIVQWLGWGGVLRGWALAMQGQGTEGVAQIRQGIAAWQATGAELSSSYHRALLAEAYRGDGQIEDGLAALADVRRLVDKNRERFYEAELYRLKGELLLRQPISDATQAEACFHQALDIARCQQAKSWELRVATSLGRLWQHQSKQDEARQLLTKIYDWFTEGFDTADLREAKALLEKLG